MSGFIRSTEDFTEPYQQPNLCWSTPLQATEYIRASALMNPHQQMWMTNKYEY